MYCHSRMGTGANRHSRPTDKFDSRELARLTKEEIVSVPIDEVEDAISEWDEDLPDEEEAAAPVEVDDVFDEWEDDVPIAAGSQPQAMPTTSRTATRSDPLTTGVLAEVARRSPAPDTLENAIRSLTPDDSVLHASDDD